MLSPLHGTFILRTAKPLCNYNSTLAGDVMADRVDTWYNGLKMASANKSPSSACSCGRDYTNPNAPAPTRPSPCSVESCSWRRRVFFIRHSPLSSGPVWYFSRALANISSCILSNSASLRPLVSILLTRLSRVCRRGQSGMLYRWLTPGTTYTFC